MKMLHQTFATFFLFIGPLLFNPVFGQKEKLNVYVDERMELLTTVQYLSDYKILAYANSSYKKDIQKYFGKFKDHPVIHLNRTIQDEFFAFDMPLLFLYHYSFPDFKPIADFTKEENELYEFDKYSDTLKLFNQLLQDFYSKSNFHAFFENHRQYYDTISAAVREVISERDYAQILEEHYGQTHLEYNVVLAPLLHDGGYGPRIRTNEGTKVYAVIGPRSYSEEESRFDANNILSYYVLHEFSHSFCNPIIESHFTRLQEDSCLISPIKAELVKQGYGEDDWKNCLSEHLVRGNEVVLNKKIFGDEVAKKVFDKYYNDKKWIYLKGLVPLIEDTYLNNRATYKTQYDLAPLVIEYFDNEKIQNCH